MTALAPLWRLLIAACLAVVPSSASATLDVEALRELVELELYGEVLAAEAEIRAAPSEDGAEPEAADRELAHALLARAVFETRGAEAALALLDAGGFGPAQTGGPVGPAALERARILIELDELAAARVALGAPAGTVGEAAAAKAPPELWLYLGRAAAREGELVRARAPLLRFLELAPRHPEAPSALYVLAQEAVRRGDGEAARQLSARGRELSQWLSYLRVRRLQVRESPDEPLPLLGLALVWMGAGELEPAADVLDRLLERFPDHAAGWFHRGEVRRLSGDLSGARADYDRALELDEEQALARFNRAVIARMEGRDADARADFERLIAGDGADDPRLLNAHLELARILRRAGEDEPAALRYAQYVARGGRESF